MIRKNKFKYYCKRSAAGLLVALLVFSSGGNSVLTVFAADDDFDEPIISAAELIPDDGLIQEDGLTVDNTDAVTAEPETENVPSDNVPSENPPAEDEVTKEEAVETSEDGSVWKYKISQSGSSKILIGYTAPGNFNGVISIPDGTTAIGEEAFINTDNISEVIIPSSVTEIDKNAFSQCSDSLTIIVISDFGSGFNYESPNNNRIIIITLPEYTVYTSKITDYGLTVTDNLDSDTISVSYDCIRADRNEENTTADTAGEYTASVKITAADSTEIDTTVRYTIEKGTPTELSAEYITPEQLSEALDEPVYCQALVSSTEDIVDGTMNAVVLEDDSYYVTFTPDDAVNYTEAYFQYGANDLKSDDDKNDDKDNTDNSDKKPDKKSTDTESKESAALSHGSDSDSGSDSGETLGTDSVDTNENNLFDTLSKTIADFMSNKNDTILGGIVNIKEAISTGKITRKLAIWMFSVGTITLGTLIYIIYPLMRRRKRIKE